MKVTRVITQELELNLEIIDATLLTVGEAVLLPKRLREYEADWWLRSPGYYSDCATSVHHSGSVNDHGNYVHLNNFVVRPALIISHLESTNLKIGDTFKFGGKEFEIIFYYLAFCLGDIGYSAFRKDWEAPDSYDYLRSDVKKYIDNWFEDEIIDGLENGTLLKEATRSCPVLCGGNRGDKRMTNLEKWKKKLAEAKDGSDFMYILGQMDNEISWTQYCQCEECKAKWFDKKAEDEE